MTKRFSLFLFTLVVAGLFKPVTTIYAAGVDSFCIDNFAKDYWNEKIGLTLKTAISEGDIIESEAALYEQQLRLEAIFENGLVFKHIENKTKQLALIQNNEQLILFYQSFNQLSNDAQKEYVFAILHSLGTELNEYRAQEVTQIMKHSASLNLPVDDFRRMMVQAETTLFPYLSKWQSPHTHAIDLPVEQMLLSMLKFHDTVLSGEVRNGTKTEFWISAYPFTETRSRKVKAFEHDTFATESLLAYFTLTSGQFSREQQNYLTQVHYQKIFESDWFYQIINEEVAAMNQQNFTHPDEIRTFFLDLGEASPEQREKVTYIIFAGFINRILPLLNWRNTEKVADFSQKLALTPLESERILGFFREDKKRLFRPLFIYLESFLADRSSDIMTKLIHLQKNRKLSTLIGPKTSWPIPIQKELTIEELIKGESFNLSVEQIVSELRTLPTEIREIWILHYLPFLGRDLLRTLSTSIDQQSNLYFIVSNRIELMDAFFFSPFLNEQKTAENFIFHTYREAGKNQILVARYTHWLGLYRTTYLTQGQGPGIFWQQNKDLITTSDDVKAVISLFFNDKIIGAFPIETANTIGQLLTEKMTVLGPEIIIQSLMATLMHIHFHPAFKDLDFNTEAWLAFFTHHNINPQALYQELGKIDPRINKAILARERLPQLIQTEMEEYKVFFGSR